MDETEDIKEAIGHIKELCNDASNKPNILTIELIHEWCKNILDKYWDNESMT